MKNLPFDPNVAAINEVLKKALESGAIVNLAWERLEPIKVITDTPKRYKAIYRDHFGTYLFEIKRNKKQFVVTTDNQVVSKTADKEYLIWNFECQLAAINPKVLD